MLSCYSVSCLRIRRYNSSSWTMTLLSISQPATQFSFQFRTYKVLYVIIYHKQMLLTVRAIPRSGMGSFSRTRRHFSYGVLYRAH